MFCALGRLFMVSSLSFGFSVVGFRFPTLRLFIFFSCIPWCRCAELVFWSFGFFYSEFCGSSLSWMPCMYLFSLWGASISWWLCFWCFRHASFCFVVTLFFWWSFFLWPVFLVFLRWCLITILCVPGIVLSYILSFYLFLTSAYSNQHILW